MSFNPSIPNKPDFLAISQKQLRANYNAIATALATNHVALGKPGQGMHSPLIFRPQTVDPVTVGGQGCLFNRLVGPSNIPQLFFRPNNNLTPIQLTNSNYTVLNIPDAEYRVSTFIAGPFTVYIGYIIGATNGQLITLTPTSTLIYAGLGTTKTSESPQGVSDVAVATNVSGSQFNISFQTGFATNPIIYYLAIGI